MLLHEGACSMCVHTLWCRPLCALWKHSDEVVWTLGIAQHSTAPIETGRVGETTTSQTNVQTTAGRQLCNKEHFCLRIIPYGKIFTLWMPIRKLRPGAEQTQMNGRECVSISSIEKLPPAVWICHSFGVLLLQWERKIGWTEETLNEWSKELTRNKHLEHVRKKTKHVCVYVFESESNNVITLQNPCSAK